MKFSIIVLAYDPEGKLASMTADCLQAIKRCSEGEDYELIVRDEGGGAVKAANRGLTEAKGDYIILMNNDVTITDPKWLTKFAIPGKIGAWHMSTNTFTNLREPDMCCICFPREVVETVGLFDMQFNGGYGFDDVDYLLRCVAAGFEFVETGVKLIHDSNTTWQTYFKDIKEGMTTENGRKFLTKWPQYLK